jgi:hypothetical protein
VKYASTTMKVDQEAINWVVKVFTVGGTLALSGGVVGRAGYFKSSPHSLLLKQQLCLRFIIIIKSLLLPLK